MVESKWHKKARLNIIDYYKNGGYTVESSHQDKKIVMFRDEPSRSNFLSDADIAVINDNNIVKIIEIQQTYRPKEIVGIIKTTDICNKCKIDDKIYSLSNVELTIALKKDKEKSKKPIQMQLIKDNIKLDGCLRSFHFEEVV